jgi:hypothetical protein
MAGVQYQYPKNIVEFTSESTTAIHVVIAGSVQLAIQYADVSTTNPYGHANPSTLIAILRSWTQQGTGNDPYYRDSLQRTRVTNATPIFFATFASSVETDQFHTLLVANATVTRDANEACMVLTLDNTQATSRAVLQTRQYTPCYPGLTMICYMTGIMRTAAVLANNKVRLGLFDEYGDKAVSGDRVGSGAFFELDGAGGMSVVTRNMVGGVQTDTAVTTTSFNIDRLNGTGLSGFTLDVTKVNTYVIEICADGATIRFGVMGTNTVWYCHSVSGINLATNALLRHAMLPIRMCNLNTSTTLTASVAKLYAVTLSSEGAGVGVISPYNPLSVYTVNRSADFGAVAAVALPVTIFYPLFSIRVAAGARCRCPAWLIRIWNIRSGGTSGNRMAVVRDPTLTGAAWAAVTDSCIEYDISATSYAGGSFVWSSYSFNGAANEMNILDLKPALPFYAALDGSTGTTYSFMGARWTGTASVRGKLDWVEQYG